MSDLGNLIRRYRESKRMTRGQLALRVGLGVDANYIKSIESGANKNPRTDKLLKIGDVLGIPRDELFQAAGYDIPGVEEPVVKNPDEHLERYEISRPISIPVYGKIPHGAEHGEPLEYVYLARNKAAGKNIEAYKADGDCMVPLIEDGDIIIVDKDRTGEVGDIMVCLKDNDLICGKLVMKGNEPWLVNNDSERNIAGCQVSVVVLEVIKTIKK